MTPEELNALIAEAADPEKAPGALADIKAKVTELINNTNTLRQGITDRDAKIKAQQEANVRLLLHSDPTIPGGSPDPEEQERTEEVVRAEYRKAFGLTE